MRCHGIRCRREMKNVLNEAIHLSQQRAKSFCQPWNSVDKTECDISENDVIGRKLRTNMKIANKRNRKNAHTKLIVAILSAVSVSDIPMPKHINCCQLFTYSNVILLSSSFARKIGCWFSSRRLYSCLIFCSKMLGVANVTPGYVGISYFECVKCLWFSRNLPCDWDDLPGKWQVHSFTQSIESTQFHGISPLNR